MPASDDNPLQLKCSIRSRRPDDTLRVAMGQLSKLGISRVSDITRMDRLGLPVFASIRPRGLTLRVHAGKSVDPTDARVGAMLEAIEYAVAEPQRTQWKVETLSVKDLISRWKCQFDWMDLAPALGVAITKRTKVDAIACEELAEGGAMLLPAELVFVPWKPRRNMRQIFGASTNGLASGNSVDEAALHGLLELMERDAISMNLPRDVSEWVAPAQLPAPFGKLAANWKKLGVELAVRFVPNCFNLPCFQACLFQKDDNHVNLAAGHGLHVSKEIAVARAICEAAQSRLSYIHGGRDDIVDHYRRLTEIARTERLQAEAQEASRWFDRSRRVSYNAISSGGAANAPIKTMLDGLVTQLGQLGFRSVFRYRFPLDLQGLHVVRVIVPGLEHVHGGGRRVGPRMLKQVLGNASH
ncbi:MAG: YcaO-like family protein [Burkholderiaceae bacterium]